MRFVSSSSCFPRHRQHKRLLSCVSQFCGGFLRGYLLVFFARHCCWHRRFQLSPIGFHGECIFFVIWFNEKDSSQLSGIIELWFLDSHFCFAFFFAASDICFHIYGHTSSEREVVCFLVSLHPDHVYPSNDLSFNRTNLVKPVHASHNSLSPSTFQKSSVLFSRKTSRDVYVVLVTSMYFSGMEMILLSARRL